MAHYPGHESLQEFAKRTGRTVAAAYDDWHSRPYPEVRVKLRQDQFDAVAHRTVTHEGVLVWPARGPGLGL